MRMTFFDAFDGLEHGVEIPDEIYVRAFEANDPEALYDVAIYIERETELSVAVVHDLMLKSYRDGNGSERAGEWLSEFFDDDGRWDAWS